MKKLIILSATLLLALSCSTSKAPKMLILYYSQNGNTKAVAEQLQAKLGADIEAIVPVIPYDGDFQATIERGRTELEGQLPEIQPIASDLKKYDVIFLGFPVWFGTYAPPVGTLLEEYDFAGTKVVPFCTFGSGGLDSSSANLAAALPGAEILPGYGVRAARIDAVPAELDRFLKQGGFAEGEVEAVEPFPALRPATEEEAAIFDAAVDGYPMLHASAENVASRTTPWGTEYIFEARDNAGFPGQDAPGRTLKVYVLAEDGQAPVFTQVVR